MQIMHQVNVDVWVQLYPIIIILLYFYDQNHFSNGCDTETFQLSTYHSQQDGAPVH